MRPKDGGTILLVEDNPNDVLLIRRALGKANVPNPVQVVGDGEKAVQYLAGEGAYADRSRHPLPMFILLDLKLPRKSGHEVLTWIRSQPGVRRTPVVVLTSSAEKADVKRCYDIGANSYLVKPVHFDALRDLMQTVGQYWLKANEAPDTTP